MAVLWPCYIVFKRNMGLYESKWYISRIYTDPGQKTLKNGVYFMGKTTCAWKTFMVIFLKITWSSQSWYIVKLGQRYRGRERKRKRDTILEWVHQGCHWLTWHWFSPESPMIWVSLNPSFLSQMLNYLS